LKKKSGREGRCSFSVLLGLLVPLTAADQDKSSSKITLKARTSVEKQFWVEKRGVSSGEKKKSALWRRSAVSTGGKAFRKGQNIFQRAEQHHHRHGGRRKAFT